MSNRPLYLANNILQRAFQQKIPVNPMKLQRLLYLTYKEYYKQTKKWLFEDSFEAWKYGPVLTDVQTAFMRYRSEPIKGYATINHKPYALEETNTVRSILDAVWEAYKSYDSITLSELTRGYAWQSAVNNDTPLLRNDIKEELKH